MTEGLYDEEYVAERTDGLREVEGLRPRRGGRRRQDAGVAGGRDRRARARRARARARVGDEEDVPRRRRPRSASAAPAARPPAPTGRAAWSASWPCRASASRASTWAACSRARRSTRTSSSPATPRAASPATSTAPRCGINMYQRMPQLATMNTVSQVVPRLKIPEAIMDGHCEGYPTDPKSIEGQFQRFEYPAPGHSAGQDVLQVRRLALRHHDRHQPLRAHVPLGQAGVRGQPVASGSRARRSSPTSSCRPAPTSSAGTSASSPTAAATSSTPSRSATTASSVMQHKCIEPLGESRSDHQIFLDLADAARARRRCTPRASPSSTGASGCSTPPTCRGPSRWKEFLKKGYYVVPPPPAERRDPVSYRWFAEGRAKDTPELHAAARPTTPRSSARACRRSRASSSSRRRASSASTRTTRSARRSCGTCRRGRARTPTELYGKYPLQLITPHPRHSFHTQSDGKDAVVNDVARPPRARRRPLLLDRAREPRRRGRARPRGSTTWSASSTTAAP